MIDRRFEGKYKFWQWLAIALFAILTVRLMTLQLVEAPVYRTQAKLNQFRFLPIRAPRGDIVDRNGKVLAGSKIVNTISIVRQQIDEKELDSTIEKLASLLHDVYPEIDAAYIKKLLDEHQSRSYEPVVIKRDVSMEVVTRLEEHRRDLPGVMIGKEIVRYYPEGTLACHVLGYIGEISKEELEDPENKDYKPGDLIGRFGLEKQYEKYLRGVDGFQQVEVDVTGRPIPHSDLITVNPKQGDRLVLTLDADLQKVLEKSMDETLAELRKKGLPGRAGAAVVLDVRTGAVLAMASRPAFDPNLLVPPVSDKAAREYLNPPPGSDPPMINRAISSKYPPGSTFKPITGMAALESGKIDVKEKVVCKGRYWLPPYTKCWRVHGAVDFFRAMAVSCNVYFIEAGRRAGVEMIARIAHEFGLDEKTGIDLPGEVAGSFLTPEKKEEKYGPVVEKWYREKKAELEKEYAKKLAQAKSEREKRDILIQKKYAERDLQNWYRAKYNYEAKWQPYDTYFMAFGQGSNEYTPIGLANYVAALANGGKRMRPYLVQRIEDADGKVVARFGPKVVHRVDVSEKTLETVKKAMREVTGGEGGTA
ncbi:MAG: penicillin-binding protein 2, partial [Thermacetogeniaceae bacterium]